MVGWQPVLFYNNANTNLTKMFFIFYLIFEKLKFRPSLNTTLSMSSQVTNISMGEIISKNKSKYCTGDVIIMYQLIV